MTTHATPATAVVPATGGPRYAVLATPTLGGLEAPVVVCMLDPHRTGTARLLAPGEPIPYGAQPVLLCPTTVYGAICLEHAVRSWSPHIPRPWLVLVPDAPARPPLGVRYRITALKARLAGVATLPYLPALRTAETADAAMSDKKAQAAAQRLRRCLEGEDR